jgi:hypothetical protein
MVRYELSKVNKQHYDFPGFDGTACIEKRCFSIHDYCLFINKKGEAILIFLRYIDKHKNYEKEALTSKLYSELGPYGIGNMFKRKSHKHYKIIHQFLVSNNYCMQAKILLKI